MASSKLLLRRLPFPLLLSLRYLRSTRKDAYVSFLSAVAALGVTVGVAALVLVLAALAGLHERLLDQVLAATPALEVSLPVPEGTAGDEASQRAMEAILALPGVTEARRVVRGQGWLVYEGVPEPLRLVGYEGDLPHSFPEAADRRPGLYVPRNLAQRWGAGPGDVIDVVSPQPTLSPFGPQPRMRRLPLAGIFESSGVETVQRAALPLEVAESLLGRRGTTLEVAVEDLENAPAMVKAVEGALEGIVPAGATVRSWRELNRSLYFVLRMEKTLLVVAVGLIVLVAALALVVDLALVIASKRSEIGMLGAMGASPTDLRRAFLFLGTLLAALGLVLGSALGAGGAWVLDRFRLLRVPGQVMFVDHIPFRLQSEDLLLVVVLTAVLVTLASLYAGHRAAALSPVEALRR